MPNDLTLIDLIKPLVKHPIVTTSIGHSYALMYCTQHQTLICRVHHDYIEFFNNCKWRRWKNPEMITCHASDPELIPKLAKCLEGCLGERLGKFTGTGKQHVGII